MTVAEPLGREPRLQVVADPAAAGVAAARHIARSLGSAVGARGRADWATTGGSAAPAIYRALTDDHELRDGVPWHDVHVWWGDDRFVPRDHPHSNVKPLVDILLPVTAALVGTATSASRGVSIPAENLHPFRTGEAIAAGRDATWTARLLAADLADQDLETDDGGFPVLDLVLLGMGPDGHVLSVFPGSTVWDAAEWAVAVPAPTHIGPHVERVTLHPGVVRVARDVLVVATGVAKAEVLARVLGPGERDERTLPAQVARNERATWILDEAAAGRLPR